LSDVDKIKKAHTDVVVHVYEGADHGFNCDHRGSYQEAAAKLAKEWGIKIYTIGVGGEETVRVQTLLGSRLVRRGSSVDENLLAGIAEETGGIFRMAGDGDSLMKVYEEIDALETSEVESLSYIDYREYFTGFALAALILLIIEVMVRQTVFRRAP